MVDADFCDSKDGHYFLLGTGWMGTDLLYIVGVRGTGGFGQEKESQNLRFFL